MKKWLAAILFLLILAGTGHGQTIIDRYVNTGAEAGGDGTTSATSGGSCAYQSLSICLLTEDDGANADLTDDGGHILRINMQRTNGGGKDTTVFCLGTSGANFTTSSTCYIHIRATDFPTDGIWDDDVGDKVGAASLCHAEGICELCALALGEGGPHAIGPRGDRPCGKGRA